MQQERKLVRNTQNTVFGGVCSGVADYFGWDVTWVRVAAGVSLALFVGTPILIYLVLWAIIPADTSIYGPGAWGTTYQPGYQQQAGYPEGYAQGYQQAQQDSQQAQYQQAPYQQTQYPPQAGQSS